MMCLYWIACVLIVWSVAIKADHINVCISDNNWGATRIGPNDVNNAGQWDPGTDANVVNLRIEASPCCGVLSSMSARIRRTGTIVTQVWRPTGGTSYELVGTASTTCTGWNNCGETFGGAERVTVMIGDMIGWYSPVSEIVEWSWGGETIHESVQTSPTVGNVVDFGVPTYTDREYGIRFDLDRNSRPDFTSLPDTVSLSEVTNIGFSLYSVGVSDQDDDDEPLLSTTMAANTYFAFDNVTRDVTVLSNLGPAPSPQVLTFTVVDQCHRTDTETLTVNIINEPPVITNLPNSTTLHENTVTETFLYTVSATDSYDPVSCSINSVNPPNTGFKIIQGNNGDIAWDISTQDGSFFDYDAAGGSHDLTIRCDDGDDFVDGVFTVSLIPNSPPVIHNLPNSTSLHEDTSIEILLTGINVTDADSPSVTCAFGAGTSAAEAAGFRIRQITGGTEYAIYTKAGATYDYKTLAEYSLDVECTDGRDSANAIFTVYLERNEPPLLTNLPANVELSTNAPVGYTVFQALASDTENDQLNFYISCTPIGCPFTVFDSGHIQLNTDISANSQLVGYDVDVTVSDHRNNGTTKTLTVTFVDINDFPEIQNLGTTITVPENSALNSQLVTTVCTDFDPSDTLTYSMACSPAEGNVYFKISSTTGVISTSSSAINYEALVPQDTYTCSVTCSDGLAEDVKTLTVVINDVNEQPRFAQDAFSLNANEGPMGMQLQNTGFSVVDPDTGDSKQFSLDCGAYTGYFTVASSTGIISFTSDYDVDTGSRPTSLSCTLTVVDSGGLTDTADIQININNINDNTPVFGPSSYSFFVNYYAPVSTNVGTVTATDGDTGSFGQLTYSIDQGNLGDTYFGVYQNGQLYVNKDHKPLGYGSTVTLNVKATDGGGLQSTAAVTIVISSTTTTSTTTTTDRYRDFFEDTRNIGWFSAAVVALAVTAVVAVFMVARYWGKAPASLTKLKWKCCRVEKITRPSPRITPREQGTRNQLGHKLYRHPKDCGQWKSL